MDKAVASLDLASALKRLDGDTDMYQILVGVFLEDLPLQMRVLCEALRTGDTTSAIGVAHTLKSSSRTVGAMVLGDLFAELEHSLGPDGSKPADNVCEVLLDEFAHIACLLEGGVNC